MKQIIKTADAPQPVGPYNQAIVSGNFVFTAGQIALDPQTGKMVGSSIEEQTDQVLKNLSAILKAASSSLDKVVKVTIFLKNLADFPQMNRIYAEYFSQSPPARTTVEASNLPLDALIEIECIAEVGH